MADEMDRSVPPDEAEATCRFALVGSTSNHYANGEVPEFTEISEVSGWVLF